jgi:diaminohydroxyphosphoribosylaminopyrimidine deaminase/5-amino-6-(5-phosphoribosylamino)uracil reductase
MIRRAIRLAMNGRGRVEPNPMVGCVIARGDRIIGEGWHTHFGGPHAEPQALADCLARGESPAGATAYVTLEPCCHTNKKTPPCAPRLIEAKIAKVVVGCLDPNPQVNGNGVAMLRAAGIEVERVEEKLEAECKQLIAPFLLRTQFRKPYVTMKWAETADGKIAGPGGRRLQITGEPANRLVHQLRARSDAIMVGVNTVLADDPQLTARGVEYSRLHTLIVLDSDLRTPPSSRLFESAGFVYLYASTLNFGIEEFDQRAARLLSRPATMTWSRIPDAMGNIPLPDLFDGDDPFGPVDDLMVEPGPTLSRSFFDANLANRLWVFRSTLRVNDDTAPNAAMIPDHFVETGRLQVGEDHLTEYLNKNSNGYFAAAPSADFVLAREAS